jgi:hypothetical protein
MNAAEIVQVITERAWRFGVAVLLSPDDHVKAADNLPCAGYFDESVPVLAVACGKDEEQWLGVLLHEYSHLTQWAEDAPVWRASHGDEWVSWLDGKPVRRIKEKIAAAREVEADCERRTVRLIRELDAPIDIERYVRAANSYVHFYNVMAEKRKWYAAGRGPYAVAEVMALASPTLDPDYSKTPKPLWDALLTCV